jgi:hypothetical protein
MDEMNKSRSLCAAQELFLVYDFDRIPDVSEITKVYDVILPFVLWRRQDWPQNWMPRVLYDTKQWSNRYLAKAEALAIERGAASFGFKVLSHNLEEWPFLSGLLKERSYRAIYLVRNITRQVLSGMVANQSGLWNSREEVKHPGPYVIDVDDFQRRIEWTVGAIERDRAWLKAEGFEFIVVMYEELCHNRQSFYEKIFDFLELPIELPPKSDYSVIIKDLRSTIANYEVLLERAAAMGVPVDAEVK